MTSPDDPIRLLARLSREARISVTPAVDEALAALDAEMDVLADALQVEYHGPGVGMADMAAEHVYRLVVRHHVWDVATAGWGLRICDALDNNDARPMWSLRGVGRLRKQQVIRALPVFFRGYAEAVGAAGRGDTEAGHRVRRLAQIFSDEA